MAKSFSMDKTLISYHLFDKFPEVKAFTTCRNAIPGEAKPRFTGKPEEKAMQNREELAALLGLNVHQLVFPGQTHTSTVAEVHKIPQDEFHDTDALMTNKPGICLCIQTADCVPVLLCDPVRQAIAAVHAGWRGTTGRIVREVIRQFISKYQSSPDNIFAVMGPAISVDKYEVGKEVVDAIRNNIPKAGVSIRTYAGGKYKVNLYEANKQVLLECGVPPGNIEISGFCTFSRHDLLFSARRDGIETGRLVSGVMLHKI